MIPLPGVVVTRKLVFTQTVRWFAHIHTRYVLKSILITCADCKIINLSKSVCVHNETKIKNWLDLKIIGDVFFFKCDMVSFSTHLLQSLLGRNQSTKFGLIFINAMTIPLLL